MTTVNVQEGYVAFPRKLSLAIAISFATALIGQTGGLGWYAAKLDSRIAELEQADRRLAERGDERFKAILMRIETLERDRDRLARLEERFARLEERATTANEMLREIRQDVRAGAPRRRGE